MREDFVSIERDREKFLLDSYFEFEKTFLESSYNLLIREIIIRRLGVLLFSSLQIVPLKLFY